MADKEEIRDRSDIIEVIGSFVPLKRKGKAYLGLCPFHQEKTPSFNVDPVFKTFKCFGCGEGGDLFTFVEKYQNMTFVEAAEFLARRLGLTLDKKGGASPEKASEREQIYEANAIAAAYYRKILDRAQSARDYLTERGLAHETIQQFQIGFATDDREGLLGHLHSKKIDPHIAQKAGLVMEGHSGWFDMFRNRILFPIHDEQERIVGFGGRAMGDEQPKYLNTGETPVFNKSRLLYGLPFARRKIAEEGKSLLMEGYTDVIAAHQAGFTNAIATLGTSLTEEHSKKLQRLAPIAVLVYDADNAGIKATLRASEILEAQGIQVRVVCLPAGDDPDSLLKRGETAAFQKAIDGAVGRVEYQLDRIVTESDHATEGGNALMLRKIVEILSTVAGRAERDAYIGRIWKHHPMAAHGPSVASQQLHRDAETRIAEKRRAAKSKGSAPAKPVEQVVKPQHLNSQERAERELLRALADSEWRVVVLQRVTPDDFLTENARRFAQFVGEHAQDLSAEPADLAAILDRHEEEDFSLSMRQLLQEIHAGMEKVPVTEAAIEGCAKTLRQFRIEQLKAELRRLPVDVSSRPSTDDNRARVQEYTQLLRRLMGIEEQERQD